MDAESKRDTTWDTASTDNPMHPVCIYLVQESKPQTHTFTNILIKKKRKKMLSKFQL